MQAPSRDGRSGRGARPAVRPVPLSDDDGQADHRARLVQGMATALTHKGYADISVTDIVQHAKVSKRTFYEYFDDKEACYLATYSALSDDVLARIAAASAADVPPQERLVAATQAYLAALDERPALTRTFLTEIQGAGHKALKLRRSIHARFAELLRLTVERARREEPELRALSPAMAAAIVGGINELVLLAIEDAPSRDATTENLQAVGGTVIELLEAVLFAAPRSVARAAPRRRTRLA